MTIRVDSVIEDFDAIASCALRAADASGIVMSAATIENLDLLGIARGGGQTETAAPV
jgi:hypothetical protein